MSSLKLFVADVCVKWQFFVMVLIRALKWQLEHILIEFHKRDASAPGIGDGADIPNPTTRKQRFRFQVVFACIDRRVAIFLKDGYIRRETDTGAYLATK
jgi:hypothetical protein